MTPVPKNVGGQVLPAGAQPLRPDDPTAIGGHRLAGRLTAGRTRVVYLARDGQGGLVAVKTSRTGDGHAEVRRRLRREAACLHRLPATCAVRLLVDGSRQAPPYLVSEYVEGPALRDLVEEQGPLDGMPVRALATAFAHALAVVHDARIAHCDVRPGNVLLAPDGPRLMDFGVAEEIGAPGDPDVSVPDDPLRDPPIGSGPARDVFGWGCLVTYAATGNRRFADADLDAPAALGLARELDDVPEPLRGLVEAALAEDPAARPTARDLAARLHSGDRASRRLPPRPDARAARPVAPGGPATGPHAAASALERSAGPPPRPIAGPVSGPSAGAPASPPHGPATAPRATGGVPGPGHQRPAAASFEPRRERPAAASRVTGGVPGPGHQRPAAASFDPGHDRPAASFDPGPGPEPGTGGFATPEGHDGPPAATSCDPAGRTRPRPGSSGVPGNGRDHGVGASFRSPAGAGQGPAAAFADGAPTEAFELPAATSFGPAAGSGTGADAFAVRRAEGTTGPADGPSGPAGAGPLPGYGARPAAGPGVAAAFGPGVQPVESMVYDDPDTVFAGDSGGTWEHGTDRRPRRGRVLVVLSGLALLTGACAAVVATTGTGGPARPAGPADPGPGAVRPSSARGTHRPAVLRGRGVESGTPDPKSAADDGGTPRVSSDGGTPSRRHRSGGSSPGTASARPGAPTKKPTSPSPTPSKTPTPSPTPTPSSPGA